MTKRRLRALFVFSALAMPTSVAVIVWCFWPGRAWAADALGALFALGLFAAFMAGSLYSGSRAAR